mmetsp:Transcript_5165/g.10240  ORF Transcript_5165/g.10240 Transcript_5165/m.10240 type:complete len:138 (+) Transcript_5165:44-457(+)
MLQPSAEQQRDAAIKDAMKKKFRELQDDEMPVITNMEEFAHESEKIKEMLRREHQGEDYEEKGVSSTRTSKPSGSGKMSKRVEDAKADALEKEGKHAFRSKKRKGGDEGDAAKKKKKKKKKRKVAASLLSFDEPEDE